MAMEVRSVRHASVPKTAVQPTQGDAATVIPKTAVTDGSTPWFTPGSSAPAAGHGLAPISIFDAEQGEEEVQKSGGPVSSDPVAAAAFKSLQSVESYYYTQYGRNGWDGKGGELDVLVNDSRRAAEGNAAWMGKSDGQSAGKGIMDIGAPLQLRNGQQIGPFAGKPDILAHEFTHAVMQGSGVILQGKGQGGGLNESWADVLGTGIDNDWQIGKNAMLGHTIRDLAHPDYSSVSDMPQNDPDPHDWSEIPSFAAYTAAKTIGAEPTRQIWYRAMTNYLKSGSGYSGALRATVAAATEMYGSDSAQTQAVKDAWTAVGVTPNLTSSREQVQRAAQARFAATAAVRAGAATLTA